MNQPLVSVVTPFHNTAPYLAECIESVLAQNYTNFEYILVDNCSTDGSREIAEAYERQDNRIRLVRRSRLLSQVENYNLALGEISEASRYCKIVQADDFIFPECLRLMVHAFEQCESIGLVSSYWLKGNELRGSGFPYPTPVLAGREMARLYLRKDVWVFGSPTAVMYRSCMIKKGQPFYDETQWHEDSDTCMKILEQWDFGFVHQLLSFSRLDNVSISFSVRDFQPAVLARYILVQRYASVFLEADEAVALKRKARREYYRVLAKEALHGWGSDAWQYHVRGLCTIGETLNRPYLALQVARQALWNAANPAAAIGKVLRSLRGGRSAKNSAASSPIPPERTAAPDTRASHPMAELPRNPAFSASVPPRDDSASVEKASRKVR
jgi:glycosyltransferase involved in cell wall biosynthesis